MNHNGSNVIPMRGPDVRKDDPRNTLEEAKSWGMDRCLVMGVTEQGEFRFGGSYHDLHEILLLLEIARERTLHWKENIPSGA